MGLTHELFSIRRNSVHVKSFQIPANDIFPDTVIGPQDQLVLLEGLSAVVKEGYKLTVNSVNYEVKRAQAIVGSVSLQYAMVLEK